VEIVEGCPRKPRSRAAAALAIAGLLGGRAEAQSGNPPPPDSQGEGAAAGTDRPTPAPGRLRLDIDRHVEERFAQDERRGIPRFETHVEVVGKSPQAMIDRFFGGVDLECTPGGAPPGGGAPSHIEMREARGHPRPTADFQAALVKVVTELFKDKLKGPERYFLYRVRNKDGVSYLLREGRVPDKVLYSTPGTTYELIEAFSDTKSGARALRRRERGFATAVAPSAPPPADWQTSTCRPR
jgi:hypothetical protein